MRAPGIAVRKIATRMIGVENAKPVGIGEVELVGVDARKQRLAVTRLVGTDNVDTAAYLDFSRRFTGGLFSARKSNA